MQFEWDTSNWPKCGQHGLTKREIEFVLSTDPFVQFDARHSKDEPRFIAVGQNAKGRFVFIVFCFRGGAMRPISARYMHQPEIVEYLNAKKEKG